MADRFRNNWSDTDRCPMCPTSAETAEHVLAVCHDYQLARGKCLRALAAVPNAPPFSPSLCLGVLPECTPPAVAEGVLGITGLLIQAVHRKHKF